MGNKRLAEQLKKANAVCTEAEHLLLNAKGLRINLVIIRKNLLKSVVIILGVLIISFTVLLAFKVSPFSFILPLFGSAIITYAFQVRYSSNKKTLEKEIAKIEKQAQIVLRSNFDEIAFLPQQYRNSLATHCLYELVASGKADSLFQAITIYEEQRKLFRIETMDGWQYEQHVAEKLKEEGFYNIQVTSGSGDYGADIIAYDLEGRKYCIQCKLYNSPVGIKAVQEIIAAKEYYRGNIAMVITNSTFTNTAVEMATRTGVVLRSNYI